MNQLEIEEQFIAGILQSVDSIIYLHTHTISIEYLTSKELKFIFNCVLDSYNKYSSLLTEQYLSDELSSRGATEEDVLKYRYVVKQLRKKVISEADFKLTIDKLTDNYISRCLIESMLQAQENLQQDKNGKQAFDLLEKNLLILKSQIGSKDVRETSTRQITDEIKLYEDMKLHPERYRGIKIGITKLDEITGGFRNGELIIVVGATEVGKSIFLANCQYNTMMQGLNSVYLTIEMSMEQARRRLVSRITGISYNKIKNVKLSDEEFGNMSKILTDFEQRADGHSEIIDVPEACNPKFVEAKVRAYMKRNKIDLIILDYLLLMRPYEAHGRLSREERVTLVAEELKQLARSLNVPIITATQITGDAGKKREKTTDEAYDWTEISQAKALSTHADWMLSLKREPDINILNLGLTKGRDGNLKGVIPLVTDYDVIKIGNCEDVNSLPVDTAQISQQDKF